MQKIGGELETVVVDWITIDSGQGNKERARGDSARGIHLRVVRNTTVRVSVFPSRTTHILQTVGEQSTVVDFMSRSLFGPNVPHSMNALTRWLTKFRMRCPGTQLIESLVHCAPNDHERNVPAVTIRLGCRWNFGSTAASARLCQSWIP